MGGEPEKSQAPGRTGLGLSPSPSGAVLGFLGTVHCLQVQMPHPHSTRGLSAQVHLGGPRGAVPLP